MPKLNEQTLAWEEEPTDVEDSRTRSDREREETFRVQTLNILWQISRDLHEIGDAIREGSKR